MKKRPILPLPDAILDPSLPTGVIVAGMGGPDGPEAVTPFLSNLFADPAVLPLPAPLARLVGRMIVRQRADDVRRRYDNLGFRGGSPQLSWARQQCDVLSTLLVEAGLRVKVEPAMRYWHPFPPEAVRKLGDWGARQFVVVPAYPQYSGATSGSVLSAVCQAIESRGSGSHPAAPEDTGSRARVHVVADWHLLPGYLDTLARRVEPVLRRWAEERQSPSTCALLPVAHSLPVRFIRKGDPYFNQTAATVAALRAMLARRLGAHPAGRLPVPPVGQRVDQPTDWSNWWWQLPGGGQQLLAFQSKVGPVRWLGPDCRDETRRLAAAGCRRLLILPISFTCEHIETIDELDVQLAATARQAGIEEFVRVDALNLDRGWLASLADHLARTAWNLGGIEMGPDVVRGEDFGVARDDGATGVAGMTGDADRAGRTREAEGVHQAAGARKEGAAGRGGAAGEPVRVAVVGAGIAGLATAYDLETMARQRGLNLHLEIFEGADAVGGKLRTIRDSGFVIEEGPNGWLDNEPATGRLLARLGLQDQVLPSEAATRHRFLLVGGRLRELPVSPGAFLRSDILPVRAKLRMAAEFFIPARRNLGLAGIDPDNDETVHAFGQRRLGHTFAETMLDPMVKGIFGGDARRLSLAAAFPRMVQLERDYGGLLKAMIKLSHQRRGNGKAATASGPGGTLHSFGGGMDVLPRALRDALGTLGVPVRAGWPVESVWREGDSWYLQAGGHKQGPFAAVIDAAPAHAAAGHLGDPDLCKLLASIPYVPMAVVALAYDRSQVTHPLRGFGMLNPSFERRQLLGVLWSTSIFEGLAPAGKVVLRCMAGGAMNPEIMGKPDDMLVRICLDELGGLYGLRGDPERAWIIRHPRAIAQYEPGHLARLAAVAAALDRQPGLFVTGSSYRGISVNHCIAEAEKVSASVLAWLARNCRAAAYRRTRPFTSRAAS